MSRSGTLYCVPPLSPQVDTECIRTIRALSIDAVQAANSGHPGLPLGVAPMAHTLWSRRLRFNPSNPNWFDRDRFVLSAGHGSALLYSLLHLSGFALPLDELMRFRRLGSMTPGHPENGLTPGVEMATGPLGQGFATAVGMAIGERTLAVRFNKPGNEIVSHRTYVIASDGDLMEGITNEAASLAGHLRLDKLTVLYDDNRITIDGSTDLAFSEDVVGRFAALGWHTLEIDGMDVEAVDAALQEAENETKRPTLIACRTTIGFGSPNKAGSSKSHGSPLGVEEVALTKQALGIPTEPLFWRSDEAIEAYRQLGEQGSERETEWRASLDAYSATYPDLAIELREAISGDRSWRDMIEWPEFCDKIQTRQASGKCIQAIAKANPRFIGGSADLAESNNTLIEGSKPMSVADPAGRNIYFGVREHAMAAAVNGMNLHGGLTAFGASFLIFSDYCRPSIRLAALMKCPSIFIFTHDSIGVGEDGPTHQPIEHLMSLRAIPNLNVMRPADGNETAACWAIALESTKTPSLLALTRQPVPACTPAGVSDHPARRGGYVLVDSDADPEIVLVATGSEVSLAIEAKKILDQEGIAVRVVSLPSFQLFELQPEDYRLEVLPKSAKVVSIEMGATLGWAKYADLSIGIDTFGESGALPELLEHFGFTPQAVAKKVLSILPVKA